MADVAPYAAGAVLIVVAAIVARRRTRRGSWSLRLEVHRDRDDRGV